MMGAHDASSFVWHFRNVSHRIFLGPLLCKSLSMNVDAIRKRKYFVAGEITDCQLIIIAIVGWLFSVCG